MAKFKFKNYQKTDGDEHISRRLQDQHEDAPNSITEEQLSDGRVEEKNVLMEKLLESKRLGSTTKIIEKSLNDADSDFDIVYRNSSTYDGNINKLEEKRIANDKMEDEKYEVASSTPKQLRWWEKETTQKKSRTSINKIYVSSKVVEAQMQNDNTESGTVISDELLASNSMKIVSDHNIDKDRIITLKFNLKDIEEEEIADVAAAKINYELNIPFVSPEDFDIPDIDEESGEGTIELVVENKKSSTPVVSPNMFVEESFTQTEVGGTPMVVGKISFKKTNDVEIDEIVNQAVAFVNQKHPDIKVNEKSFDLSQVEKGILEFTKSVGGANNMVEASSQFDIVVVSKKK